MASGMPREEVDLELAVRAAKEWGVSSAAVPRTFPLELADRLRASGIELDRRPRPLPAAPTRQERRRAGRDPPRPEGRRRGDGRRARPAAAAPSRSNGSVVLDGEPLTSERLKYEILRVFGEHGLAADEFIVSHGPQSAVGHDMGSGAIAPDEPIVIDIWPRDRESVCYADMTRTFVVGTPSDELARVPPARLRRARSARSSGSRGRRRAARSSPRSASSSSDAGHPTPAVEAARRGARQRLLPRARPRGRARGARAAVARPRARRDWSPATWSRSSRASTATATAACGSRTSCSSPRTAART